jgi:muconolactone delta-isomerase
MIISAQNADNLKTLEKKEQLRSAMPDRGAAILKKWRVRTRLKSYSLFQSAPLRI